MLTPTVLVASAASPEALDPQAQLLKHLEGLFALAQVVTMNAERAVHLVEETYRRAFALLASTPLPADERTWLYALMLQVHDERTHAGEADAGDPDVLATERATAGDDFRSRLAEQFVNQALPAAFTTLSADQRLLLMLCEVENLSCEAAGEVLGLPAEAACARLELARAGLHEALYANATEVERHLLDTSLPDNWDRAALAHLARTELVPLPPTLRPAVHAGPSELSTEPVAPDAALVPADDDTRAGLPIPWGRFVTRLTTTLLIILVAGLTGYAFSSLLRREPETNLINLSVEQADEYELDFRTDHPEQAERYVRDRLGWRVVLPGIEGAALQGVGIREVTTGVEAPAFAYEDEASGALVTVFVYNYTLLDRYDDRIVLERDILRQIEDDGNYDLYDLGEERVLVWRNRDDIFVAVTPLTVSDLRDRITFPS